MRLLFGPLAFVVFLCSGCATGPTRHVRIADGFDTKMGAIKRVAIVSDVALIREVVTGKTYFSNQDSRDAERLMLGEAQKDLVQRGYEVSFTEAPFVGGFKDPSQSLRLADEAGGEIREAHPPFSFDEKSGLDESGQKAMTRTLYSVSKALSNQSELGLKVCCSSEAAKQDLQEITKKAPTDAVLIIFGAGVLVPPGKSVAQGIATGVLTTVLTLGMVTYAQWSVSALNSYAVLIDSKSGEILWTNRQRFKGRSTDADFYADRQWSSQVLFQLPSKIDRQIASPEPAKVDSVSP